MTAFAWRVATRSDLPRIVEIYNGTIASREVTADLDPVSVDSRVAWFEAHSPGHRPLWVSETDGAIAGWLSFSSFYGRPAYEHTAEISVYLDAARRRQGLGGFLLDQAIAHAPSLGLQVLLAFVFAHNHASVALFQGRAFESWGLLPRVARLDDTERDLAILGRRL